MKVMLMENVDNLGACGDEVTVRDGYARNFLIPKGMAIQATPNNVKQFNHQKSLVQRKVKKLVGAAQGVADQIAALSLTITKKVGEQGKLYGSVTSQEIAGMVQEQGVSIDRRKIHLAEPIKSLGEFRIPVKLHPQVTAEIKLTVVGEAAEEPVAEAAPADAPEAATDAPRDEAAPE